MLPPHAEFRARPKKTRAEPKPDPAARQAAIIEEAQAATAAGERSRIRGSLKILRQAEQD